MNIAADCEQPVLFGLTMEHSPVVAPDPLKNGV
jgi:hypothetical protein